MAKVRERVIIDGETKWVTANSRQEAQLAVAQLLYDAGKLNEHKNAVKAKGLTLRQFVIDTYKPRFVDHLKPTTVATYEQYLFLNILPFLGDMPITAIRLDTIVDFRQWMATAARGGRKKNLNADSIRRVTGFL